MAIDYTKHPAEPDPGGAGQSERVSLTKSAPTVSLSKHGAASGQLRVNLNWNALPQGGGGWFRRPKQLDLDLGCLYELGDGTKGIVQALGNAFSAQLREAPHQKIIWLDADDRSGQSSEGENLHIDLSYADKIKRVLVFALIYEGAANWAAADGVVTLYPAHGPEVEVRLDEPRDGARICAVAMLESSGGDLSVRREVNYLDGGQRLLDETYGWGMKWTAGRK
jgi:tellurite resistance protein TerA